MRRPRERVDCLRRRLPHDRRADRLFPKTEPIEISLPAVEGQLVQLDDVLAVARHREVERPAAPINEQIATGGIGDDDRRIELRVDPARRAIDDDSLPLLGLERVMIDGSRREHPVADRVHRQLNRIRQRCIRLRLRDLIQSADRKYSRRRHAEPRHHAGLINANRTIGRDIDEVLIRLRLPRRIKLASRLDPQVRERQIAEIIQMLARNRDLNLSPCFPAHRHRGQQPRSRETN